MTAPVNDYLTFAAEVDANVLAQDAYAELIARDDGFPTGQLASAAINKVLRQASMLSAALAQVIVDADGLDLLDDGNLAALVTRLKAMLQNPPA